jgi:hypothetical protein
MLHNVNGNSDECGDGIMSKGNGIELLKKNHLELGKLYQKQIKVNDDQTIEIERLKKLSSNYGTVCKDCCTATSKQEELSNQVDDLTYERDLAVYGLVMILVVNIGKVLIWGF